MQPNDKELTPERLGSMKRAAVNAMVRYNDVSPVLRVSAAELDSLVNAAEYAIEHGWNEDDSVSERSRLVEQ